MCTTSLRRRQRNNPEAFPYSLSYKPQKSSHSRSASLNWLPLAKSVRRDSSQDKRHFELPEAVHIPKISTNKHLPQYSRLNKLSTKGRGLLGQAGSK
mmetsp:Transcript_3361/g.4141  ORF Transcript_3361/g.4141 Transcript_3361/m.4141 type:complete len:97 (+) Transcript_3361:58-348(+)